MGTKYESGRYILRVTGQGFGESKNEKKTPFFFLDGDLVGVIGPDGSQYQCEPGHRTINCYLTAKTVDGTEEKLKELGWPGGRWSSLDPNNGSHSFVDQEIEVECSHEPGFNDPTTLYEKWQLPFAGGGMVEHDPTVTSKIDALFGKAAQPKKLPPKAPAAGRTPLEKVNNQLAEAAASVQGEDDPPF